MKNWKEHISKCIPFFLDNEIKFSTRINSSVADITFRRVCSLEGGLLLIVLTVKTNFYVYWVSKKYNVHDFIGTLFLLQITAVLINTRASVLQTEPWNSLRLTDEKRTVQSSGGFTALVQTLKQCY
jgi:hypothetical protein